MITSGRQRDILNGWKIINKEMTGLWSVVIYDKRNTTHNIFAIHVYNTPAYIWLTIITTNLVYVLHYFVFHSWIGSSEYD
jgi:heme/copper-type cytochrome/quinol oxidase subunit 2